MIPLFRKNGLLPIGEHPMTLEGFKKKFAHNLKRRQIFSKFEILVEDLQSIGCKVIYVDGSYTTKALWPDDIDICWEPLAEEGFLDMVKEKLPILLLTDMPRKEQQEKYNADVFPTIHLGFNYLDWFQLDENDVPKGIIKIEI